MGWIKLVSGKKQAPNIKPAVPPIGINKLSSNKPLLLVTENNSAKEAPTHPKKTHTSKNKFNLPKINKEKISKLEKNNFRNHKYNKLNIKEAVRKAKKPANDLFANSFRFP